MQKPWRRQTAVDDDQPPKRRTQSSSAELQPSGPQRRRRLIAKDRYRIVVMGSAAVGKTCIISRLLYERFVTEYKATVEELHSGDYELDGRPLTLDFLDTSGKSPNSFHHPLTANTHLGRNARYVMKRTCFEWRSPYMLRKLFLSVCPSVTLAYFVWKNGRAWYQLFPTEWSRSPF